MKIFNRRFLFSGAAALFAMLCTASAQQRSKMVDFDRPSPAAEAPKPDAKVVAIGAQESAKTEPEKRDSAEAASKEAAAAPDKASDEAQTAELREKIDEEKAEADDRYKNAYIGRLKASQPQLSADTFDYEQAKDGKLVAKGKATIKDENFTIDAKQIEFSQKENMASAAGDVQISTNIMRMAAQSATVNIGDGSVSSPKIRFGTSPIFSEASGMRGDKNVITCGESAIYFNEPDFYSISTSASSLKYTSETTTLELEDMVVWLGPVPVFYLPSFSHDDFSQPPVNIKLIEPGFNGDLGGYFKSTVLYTGLEGVHPGALFDYYSERGLLIGPAADYDYKSSWTDIKGSWESAYINDQGSTSILGRDDYGRQITKNRYFIQGKHLQTIGERIVITGELNYLHDQFVTRDFRDDHFYNNQAPDNFAEAVYYGDFYSLSAFARFQPNDWEVVQQRLPEVRFDMNPNDPLGIRLYQDGFVSAGYYQEFDPQGNLGKIESKRLDAYYGLARPIALNSWSSFTPIIGARVTHYADAYGKSSDYTRVLGQIGFDAQMDIWGAWDYRSEILDIDGLRHNMRPIMKYRYIPSASQGRDRIPQIDRIYFSSYPSMLDLGQQRNADFLQDTNTLRIGLENILQTRDTEGFGSRELARLDFYQDFNFQKQMYLYPDFSSRTLQNYGESSYSDFYIHASLSPARFLTFGGYSRINVNKLDMPEINTYMKIYDADFASLTLFSTYLEGFVTQYGAEAEYKITENYKLLGRWHYDYRLGKLTDQRYSLWTRLGNSWIIEYQIGYRSGSTRQNDLTVGARVQILLF